MQHNRLVTWGNNSDGCHSSTPVHYLVVRWQTAVFAFFASKQLLYAAFPCTVVLNNPNDHKNWLGMHNYTCVSPENCAVIISEISTLPLFVAQSTSAVTHLKCFNFSFTSCPITLEKQTFVPIISDVKFWPSICLYARRPVLQKHNNWALCIRRTDALTHLADALCIRRTETSTNSTNVFDDLDWPAKKLFSSLYRIAISTSIYYFPDAICFAYVLRCKTYFILQIQSTSSKKLHRSVFGEIIN